MIDKADAAIILGKRPDKYEKMYGPLNDLILFGGNACNNAHSLFVKIVNDLDIPVLKLAYPTTRDEIIDLINKTNSFLKNLNSYSELNTDLEVQKDRCPLSEVREILHNLK